VSNTCSTAEYVLLRTASTRSERSSSRAGRYRPIRVLTTFYPPASLEKLEQWRVEDLAALETVPDDSIRVEIGRAVRGTFARVGVEDAYADRFA